MKRALIPFLAVSAASVILACESDRAVAPPGPGVSALISDGGHSPGNPHFFLLPPLVKPATFSGVFNPGLAPVVRLCANTAVDGNGACLTTGLIRPQFTTLMGPFNPLQVFNFIQVVNQVGEDGHLVQFYFVLWRPDWTLLNANPTVTYRLSVGVGVNSDKSFGFADIKVVQSLVEYQQVLNAGQFVPLPKGAPTLPILFRIENGATLSPVTTCNDCTEQTVGPSTAEQHVVTPQGHGAISFPPNSFSQVFTITINRVAVPCLSTRFRQVEGCFEVTSDPPLPVTNGTEFNGNFARVEVCIAPSNRTNLHFEMFRSDGETTVPLAGAHEVYISCSNFASLGPNRFSDLARAGWQGLMNLAGQLVRPRRAFAATTVIDEGLGGLTPGISLYGYAEPVATSPVTPINQTAAAGATLPVSILAQFMHPASRVLAVASGVEVGFTVASGNGAVSSASGTTGPGGIASTNWTLPSTPGTYALNAVSPGASSVTFTGTAYQVTSLIDCGAGVSGDLIQRGFYVLAFPGTNLDRVTLYLSATTAGTYTFSLAARSGTYGGTLLGTAVATVQLTGSDVTNVATTFTFPSLPVTNGGTVTFAISQTAGPTGAAVFYAVPPTGDTACPVTETEGTTPPLDTFRRQGVNVKIEGASPPIL